MNLYETDLPPDMTSIDVNLDDTVDGYGHNFTLQYLYNAATVTGSIIMETFAFGSKLQCILVTCC